MSVEDAVAPVSQLLDNVTTSRRDDIMRNHRIIMAYIQGDAKALKTETEAQRNERYKMMSKAQKARNEIKRLARGGPDITPSLSKGKGKAKEGDEVVKTGLATASSSKGKEKAQDGEDEDQEEEGEEDEEGGGEEE